VFFSRGFINIKRTPTIGHSIKFEIYNLNGQVLCEYTINGGNSIIIPFNYPDGIYLYSFKDTEVRGKLIVVN
jgi:hypothetical protein